MRLGATDYRSKGSGCAARIVARFVNVPRRKESAVTAGVTANERMTASGRVSRGSPVQTAIRNCTRDEDRSFEAGSQVLASDRCKLLSSRAMVVSVAVNVGRIPTGVVERGERKRTADEVCAFRRIDILGGVFWNDFTHPIADFRTHQCSDVVRTD
jgi:hypothetical protein